MKSGVLFKILQKRINNHDKNLLFSRTQRNTLSRASLGEYYLHDIGRNKVLETHIDLLSAARRFDVKVDSLED